MATDSMQENGANATANLLGGNVVYSQMVKIVLINSRNSHSITHLVRSIQHSFVSFVYFTFLITPYTHV